MGSTGNLRKRTRLPRYWWRRLITPLRNTPWLTTLAVGLGLAGSAALAWRMAGIYTAPEAGQAQLAMARGPGAVREFIHFFIQEWLRWTFLLMAPAFLLALLRGRGSDRLLPIALASLAALAYWLNDDLFANVAMTVISNLGEEPSPAAYYGKLAVICTAFLSPTVMVWLYLKGSVLDRYIVRSFLSPFCLCFFGLLSLFIFFDFFDNGKDLLEARFGLRQIAMFYLVQVPKFLVEIIDISLLLGLLYSMGLLSRHNEIISMVTSGRSVPRILLPLVAVGVFASIITMACNYEWAPKADRNKSDILRLAEDIDIGRRVAKIRTSAERVAYMNRTDRRFWFLQNVPIDMSSDNPITGVEIHELNEDGSPRRSIFAKRAVWMPMDPPRWNFHQVREMFYQPHADPVYLDSRPAKLEEPGWRETPWRLLSESAKLPAQFLSVPQLASYLKTNREFPEFRLASYRTWWHDRLARPLRCLIVVLFAAPLGIVFSRRGLMGSVASTILLYFGMYFLTLAFIRLGETAKMPAMAAAWSVNILFGAVGLAVLWQRTTNHDLRRSWKRLFSREAA
jgi:lipopolysaccharide export system permease protein